MCFWHEVEVSKRVGEVFHWLGSYVVYDALSCDGLVLHGSFVDGVAQFVGFSPCFFSGEELVSFLLVKCLRHHFWYLSSSTAHIPSPLSAMV